MQYDTETIRRVVSCRDLCENNGIKVNAKGRARCPWHDDNRPSMAVWRDHVHCYACGAHSDAIGLAGQLYGVGFFDACRILAEMYGIAPASGAEWQRKADEPRRTRQERQNRIERLRDAYVIAVREFRDAEAEKDLLAPSSQEVVPGVLFWGAVDRYNRAADAMRRAEWALIDAERRDSA